MVIQHNYNFDFVMKTIVVRNYRNYAQLYLEKYLIFHFCR